MMTAGCFLLGWWLGLSAGFLLFLLVMWRADRKRRMRA
jgi:hypothetical protein